MSVILPRGKWKPVKENRPNEYHIIAIDPGGTTGWAHLVCDYRAFSRPDHKALAYLKSWDCGEFSGAESGQCERAVSLIHRAIGDTPQSTFRNRTDVVGEDFDLVQTIGGHDLLSPVRINAVLAWECRKQALTYTLQNRSLRTNITAAQLNLFGFEGRWTKTGKGKDMFAAMQHAVVWLRRQKKFSYSHPWKLSDNVSSNAYWDCACAENIHYACDLVHP